MDSTREGSPPDWPAGSEVAHAGIGQRSAAGDTLLPSRAIDILRAQRDGLARARDRLIAAMREMEAENEALRHRLACGENDPETRRRDEEATEAGRLAHEEGITFHHMPDDVYAGRPYVTQQELIGQGITRYSRQTISRLARDEDAVPAMIIADRLLLPPAGVRALLQRECEAADDASPRRRPGGERSGRPL